MEQTKEHWELKFNVQRSIRYYERRHAFFANCNRLMVLVGLLGYATNAIWLGETWGVLVLAAVALVFVLGIAFGTTNKAYLYQDLRRRTGEISIRLEDAEMTGDAEAIEKAVRKGRHDLLLIEQDDPPVKRALSVLCHNETIQALGLDAKEKRLVNRWTRITAQFFAWNRTYELVAQEQTHDKVEPQSQTH